MRRCVARHTLEGARRIDQRLHALVALVHLAQLRRDLQRLVQRDVRRPRHELRHDVRLGIGEVQRPAHVADRAARGHRAERDDLRHMVVAVFPAHIVHDLAAPRVAEVHINIGHRHALRIQKPFEEQPVLHRIDLRDVERIRDHRTRGASAPGADGDARLFCKVDKVRHDQEVVGKAHLLDHVNLIVQLLPVFRVLFAIALGKALGAKLFQVCQRVISRRELEFRKVIFSKREFHIAAFGNFHGIFKRLVRLWEALAQLLLGFEIEFFRLKFQAVRIVDGLAHLDAHQDILRPRILAPEVVRVVRHDERQSGLL